MKTDKFEGIKRFYTKKVKKQAVYSALIFLLIGVLEIFPVMILSSIIDIMSNNVGTMLGITFYKNNLVLLFVLLVVSFIVIYIGSQQMRAYVRIKEKEHLNKLREQMHNALIKNHNSLELEISNGEVVNDTTHNIYSVEKIFTVPLTEAITPVVAGLTSIIYLFFVNYIIAAVTLVFVPIFIFLSQKMIKKTDKLNREIKLKQEANNNYIDDVLQNLPIISLFKGQRREIEEYESIKNSLYKGENNFAKHLRKYWLIMNALRVFVFIATIGLSVWFIYNGNMSVGALFMVYNYVQNSNKPIFSINIIFNNINIGSIDIEKVYNLIDICDEKDSENLDMLQKIEYKDVCVEFPKFKINNLNMTLTNKNPNYILGDSGKGKSLSISLLYKKFDYKGEILADGRPIKKLNFDDVSVSMQNHFVFDRDILKNLQYSNSEIDKELIKILNIDIDKILTNSKSSSKKLSGGEKQKISIYRCLSKNAKLYILDEPTNDLDEITIKNLKEYIKTHKKFYIIITHDKDFILDNSNCIYL